MMSADGECLLWSGDSSASHPQIAQKFHAFHPKFLSISPTRDEHDERGQEVLAVIGGQHVPHKLISHISLHISLQISVHSTHP